jgi:hypothetical protein
LCRACQQEVRLLFIQKGCNRDISHNKKKNSKNNIIVLFLLYIYIYILVFGIVCKEV